jgi:hypothetical protein
MCIIVVMICRGILSSESGRGKKVVYLKGAVGGVQDLHVERARDFKALSNLADNVLAALEDRPVTNHPHVSEVSKQPRTEY